MVTTTIYVNIIISIIINVVNIFLLGCKYDTMDLMLDIVECLEYHYYQSKY